MHHSLTRCVLTVEAEADPTVAARILHLATVRGDFPESFSATRLGADRLAITLCLTDADEHAVTLLAAKARNLPAVLEVETSWLIRAARKAA